MLATSSFIINHNTFSDCCQFSDINISQGSEKTTHFTCVGIFKYDFVPNLAYH